MAEITAQAVNEFRKQSGLGLMECKALLKEAEGDLKKALTLAQERNQLKAAGRAGRAASAGRVEVALAPDGHSGALVELNCETDFVARNDEFRGAAKALAEQALQNGDANLTEQAFVKDPSKTVKEAMVDLNVRTGENVQFARAKALSVSSGCVDAYIHHDGKQAALVAVEGPDGAATRQLVKDLAMHIVAAVPAPIVVRRDEMPEAIVAEQKRIFLAQAADKPEQIREKIATGKLDSWYGENTLLDQVFVKDTAKKIKDVVAEASKQAGGELTVKGFARFVVGDTVAAEA